MRHVQLPLAARPGSVRDVLRIIGAPDRFPRELAQGILAGLARVVGQILLLQI